jgi:6-phosphofructokinase 1
MTMRRIGVLTSGGDAPGMNPCVRAVVRTAVFHGMSVIGIHEGYDGLVRGVMREMTARDAGGIIGKGGTILQTARCPEFHERKGRIQALRELNEAGIQGLVVIGGDGSMRGAYELHKLEFPVVGVPASIDNDIWGTNMSLGVDTALNTIMEAVDKLRDTASSHQRAFLVETMGRNCGYLALMAGIISGAEVVLIPERQVTLQEIGNTVEKAYARGKTHCIIISAEGSPLDTHELAAHLDAMEVGFNTRVTILGHTQRGGSPSAFDRLLATRMGVRAVEALREGEHGVMVGLMGREISSNPLEEVIARSREANLDYFEMAKMLAT